MSVQGQLAGRPWTVWTSPPSQPPVRVCPTPPPASEDVMKLPREDMQTFGRCPAWDAFILVTCDKCDKIVKMEAFESHMTLRHGSKSEKSAYHRVLAAKAAASLEACEVKLTPSSTATNSNSSSGGGNTPTVAESELPSSSCTSPQPNNMSRSTSPHSDTDQMDTSGPSESSKHKYMGDEADSTTNNVISIPDTDDMANIEIISEGQSLLDSMDSKFSLTQAATSSADSTSFSLASTARSNISTSSATVSVTRIGAEPMEAENSTGSGPPPTHYITVSPLSKPTISPNKKLVLGKMVQSHVAHPGPPTSEKKSGRDREYDANKHCGVLDPETKKPCTRSLTCKSHSVYLKRKVLNRSGDFDELLANHKAEKEAAAAKLVAASSEDGGASSILERRLKLSGGGQARLVSQIQVLQPGQSNQYCEDTLHYTTGWSKYKNVVLAFGSHPLLVHTANQHKYLEVFVLIPLKVTDSLCVHLADKFSLQRK